MARSSMRLAVVAVLASLVANVQAIAQAFDYDAESGAIVLPGTVDSLRTDPGDRIRASMPDGTQRTFQPPWVSVGLARTGQQVRAALASAKSQGKAISVVLLPVTGPVRWTWTAAPELVRIASDGRSAPFRAALGTSDLRGMVSSRSMTATANAVLRTMVAQSVSKAVAGAVGGTYGNVPVLVVERTSGNPPPGSAAEVLKEALSANSTLVAVGGSAGSLRAAAARSVAEFRSRPQTATAKQGGMEAPAGAGGTAPNSAPGSSPGPSLRAEWKLSGSSWSASLPDGSVLVSAWVPGTPAPQEDTAVRLRPNVEVTPVPGGLRAVFSYTNQTNRTCELASMQLPSFRLGNSIRMQDTRDLGGTVPMSPSSPVWRGTYPGILYAPACIMRNESVAVGISVEYPVLQYRHDIRLRCTATNEGVWTPELGLENSSAHCGFSYLRTWPALRPGETRVYCVNICVEASAEWLHTLSPYKAFFQSGYGAAAYARDGRPIAGIALSQLESMSPENPNGWVPGAGMPEREGFGPAVSLLESRFRDCSDRVMAWAPTGYSSNPRANYPFQFASRWSSAAGASRTGFQEAPAMLRSIAASPSGRRTLGLWWGHSANPSYSWGEDPVRALDSRDPIMKEVWFRELAAAVDSGATEIGLDAFAHDIAPAWELVTYLREAKARYPNVRFCIEPRTCDFLHVLAPTWVDGYKSLPLFGLPVSVVTERFAIGDYLIPGQETWVGMQFNLSRDPALWGSGSSHAAQRNAVANIESLGYVPVTWVPMWLKQASNTSTMAGATR